MTCAGRALAMVAGNWATDIAGGAQYRYSLLFVVLLSSITAMFLQASARTSLQFNVLGIGGDHATAIALRTVRRSHNGITSPPPHPTPRKTALATTAS